MNYTCRPDSAVENKVRTEAARRRNPATGLQSAIRNPQSAMENCTISAPFLHRFSHDPGNRPLIINHLQNFLHLDTLSHFPHFESLDLFRISIFGFRISLSPTLSRSTLNVGLARRAMDCAS